MLTTPSRSFSRSSGTASTVRAFSYWRTTGENPGSTVISATWIVWRSRAAFLTAPSGPSRSLVFLHSSANSGDTLCSAAPISISPSYFHNAAKLPSHSRVALVRMVSNTGARSVGELEITCSTSDIAACCSSAWERCPRASATSRVRTSSCFFNSTSELGPLLTGALAFVPVERSRVGLFAPLRDKVTSSAPSSRPSDLSILTEPHDELLPHSTPRRTLFAERNILEYLAATAGSLRLDARELNHLSPLLGFGRDEICELGRRTGEYPRP